MARTLIFNRQYLKRTAYSGAETQIGKILKYLTIKGHEIGLSCCNLLKCYKEYTAKFPHDTASDKTENLIELVLI